MDQAIWSELLVAKSIAIHPWLLEKTDATDYAAGDGSTGVGARMMTQMVLILTNTAMTMTIYTIQQFLSTRDCGARKPIHEHKTVFNHAPYKSTYIYENITMLMY